jgi:two-component system sensor histidine kinase KdpD
MGYAVAGLGDALATAVIGVAEPYVRIANVSLLYLIVVLVAASAYGRGPAIFASVGAFLLFDWFFVAPRFALGVAEPDGLLSLLVFLSTAIITGQLAAAQRRRAREAAQREQEMAVLYDVVRLLVEPDLTRALQAVAERLLHELQLAAVVIDVNDEGGRESAHTSTGAVGALPAIGPVASLSRQVLGEGAEPTPDRRGSPGGWVAVVPPGRLREPQAIASDRLHQVPVLIQGRPRGTILLVTPPGAARFTAAHNRLLSALAAQLGLAVERRRLRREATEAEILRGTDELKTALLNAVSHDLRTPLASIIACAGSLRQTDVAWTEADKQEFAESIEQEARRLNRLVGNLLDVSRMEAGGLRPEKGWYDLGALIDDVLGRLRPLLSQHRVVVELPDDLPPVPLDYVEIDQVLSNLVENAARYAPSGTEIGLAVRLAGAAIQVSVTDEGPGIAPAALSHLFEPFYRGGTRGPRPPGTGLGLAVAQGLVAAHGGRIWAENRAPRGARFVFTLPLSPLPVAAPAEGPPGAESSARANDPEGR